MEKFTSSNSANAMSKSIGQQIDKLIEHQSKLEKDFDNLIQQKTKLIDLVDNDDINILIRKIKGVAKELKKVPMTFARVYLKTLIFLQI